MATGLAAVQGLAQPRVDGVQLKRHPLELEAARALQIAKRVGRRLVRWIREIETQEQDLERVVGRDPETGLDIREVVKNADGKVIRVPVLPNDEFRESWALYERTVRNLLVEQRARAVMKDGAGKPPMSDEEFNRQIGELAKAAVLEMPRAELEALLRQRHVDIVEAAVSPARAKTSSDPASDEVSKTTDAMATSVGADSPVLEAEYCASDPTEHGGNGDFLGFGDGDDSE